VHTCNQLVHFVRLTLWVKKRNDWIQVSVKSANQHSSLTLTCLESKCSASATLSIPMTTSLQNLCLAGDTYEDHPQFGLPTGTGPRVSPAQIHLGDLHAADRGNL